MVDPPSSGSQAIRFGDFDADLRSGELRKHGTRLKLQAQPFQVLQVLLEHAGEVVTREELQKRIWPADTFVDFDHGLNNAVKKLREALGDDAEKPRYIETLSKRGYRFISPVQEPEHGVRPPVGPPVAVTVDSIAVLPFTSMSPDPEDEFFADGMTEEIINALAQIEQLHVVARTSAFSFKGKYIDVRAVGKRLNVRTILLGSVRRAGNELRITAQLVSAEDGYHLWSDRYDREVKDIFEIQDDIARSIAERLKVTFDGGRHELVRVGSQDLAAYQLYLRGRELLFRRESAFPYLECFQRAVNLDPAYAQVWAGLADSHTVLGYSGVESPGTSMANALEAARRAVKLAPSLAEGRNALAMASLMGLWDRATAEREFVRAIQLNQRYTQARAWYGLFYLQFSEGRMAEGVAQAKLALKSDPLSSYAHAIYGLTCGVAGKHAEAMEACERAVQIDSGNFLARALHQMVLHLTGRLEESVAAGEIAVAMSGRQVWSMVFLALSFAEWGKAAEADAVYSEMLARARRHYVSPATLAVMAASADRQEDAIKHVQLALEIRDPMCHSWFSRAWRAGARLRSDARFREMAARVGRSDWL